MQIYDNLIPLEYQEEIKNLLLTPNFPWYFQESNVDDKYQRMLIVKGNYNSYKFNDKNPQFTHLFFLNDEIRTDQIHFNIIKPLIELIGNKFDIKNSNINKLRKIKANLLLPSRLTCENEYNIPHTDMPKESNTALYYVNDCDGDTILFKENLHTYKDVFNKDISISPKMGRVAFFDSSKYHTSSCPINSKYRIVLNIVYST